MSQLLSHPLFGTDYAHVLTGYRSLQVEYHAVFYRVLQSKLRIVRVLHQEMDAPLKLLD
ncbi:type II toxin-antitoxin system RelE/ParE family toxin [Arsukibacterium sp.]|uniref:type II toxin-antitoxin system RelE/ParE family toxin n=1 Tax=Arsukibacterium sp. TaxID=1977258 RepID=UPI0039A43994